MTKLCVLAVRDSAADVYGSPFFVPSIGVGIRNFGEAINKQDENNMMYQHPEDFSLWSLGVYDDGTGAFETHVPKQVARGQETAIRKNGSNP